MYVCEKCHKFDEIAIQCLKNSVSHTFDSKLDNCEICGNYKPLIFCDNYETEHAHRISLISYSNINDEYKCNKCTYEDSCILCILNNHTIYNANLCGMFAKKEKQNEYCKSKGKSEGKSQ